MEKGSKTSIISSLCLSSFLETYSKINATESLNLYFEEVFTSQAHRQVFENVYILLISSVVNITALPPIRSDVVSLDNNVIY